MLGSIEMVFKDQKLKGPLNQVEPCAWVKRLLNKQHGMAIEVETQFHSQFGGKK